MATASTTVSGDAYLNLTSALSLVGGASYLFQAGGNDVVVVQLPDMSPPPSVDEPGITFRALQEVRNFPVNSGQTLYGKAVRNDRETTISAEILP